MKYNAQVNNDAHFTIEKKANSWLLNGEEKNINLKKLDNNRYHLLFNHASFTIEIIQTGYKEIELVINGKHYSVALSDEYDALLKELGINTAGNAKAAGLKAPMPGLILKLLVKEGVEVKKGDNLLVLEAMKMENMIKAQDNYVIKNIPVKEGQTVEKGQALLLFM